MTPTSPRKLRDEDLYRYCGGGGDDGNQNGTVVAMTKTERWYAIVEELRAHRRHVCGINRDVVERARSESNRGSDGSAEYFCR